MKHKLIKLIRLRNIGLIIVDWLRRMPTERYLHWIALYRKAGISVMFIAAFALQGLAWGHTSPTPLSPGQKGWLRPLAAGEGKSRVAGGRIAQEEIPRLSIIQGPAAHRDKAEFHYVFIDGNNRILREPCGFPGHWTAEVRTNLTINSIAAAQRMVKSFTLSMSGAGKGEIKQGRFVVDKRVPKKTINTIFRSNLLSIERSEKYGLIITATPAFLTVDALTQRDIFSAGMASIPSDADVSPAPRPKGPVSVKPAKGMRILIFNEPIVYNEQSPVLTPTAFSLASLLRQNGITAEINNFDYISERNSMKRSALRKKLKNILREVDCAMISLFDPILPPIKEFVALLREAKPNLIIVVGGPSATVIPEHVAAYLAHANVVYRGEAERGLVPVLRALEGINTSRPDADQIDAAMAGQSGVIVKFGNVLNFSDILTVNRVDKAALDRMRPDFSLITAENAAAPLRIMTSRGCSWGGCTFCATGNEKIWTAMSPEDVIDLVTGYQRRLEELETQGADIPPRAWQVEFEDNNFLEDPERAIEIFRRWKEAGLRLRIGTVQADLYYLLEKGPDGLVVNAALIRRIAEYGGIFVNDRPDIQIGTDAFVDEEIRRLGKHPYTYELIEGVMAECEKREIKNAHYLILTNASTSVKNMLLTVMRVTAIVSKYKMCTVENVNIGIGPLISTRAVDEIVQNRELALIKHMLSGWSAEAINSAPGFPEYDLYRGEGTYIHSRRIPDDIYRAAEKDFEALRANNVRLNTHGALIVTYDIICAIQKNLRSIEQSRWPLYRDLLDDRFVQEATGIYTGVEEQLLRSGAPAMSSANFSCSKAREGFSELLETLKGLKHKFEPVPLSETNAILEGAIIQMQNEVKRQSQQSI